jgi:hypothetical protein
VYCNEYLEIRRFMVKHGVLSRLFPKKGSPSLQHPTISRARFGTSAVIDGFCAARADHPSSL